MRPNSGSEPGRFLPSVWLTHPRPPLNLRAMIRLNPFLLLSLTALSLGLASPLPAADEPKPDKKDAPKSDEKKDDAKEHKETKVESDGEVTIEGKKIAYHVTAGTITLTKAYGEPKASVFYTAYTRKDAGDASKRPVCFAFNGGPGSSAVWLHLGCLGPKRVLLPPGGATPPKPPYELVPNEFSILDDTDLVFIDPVSTGFSRPEKGEDPKQFHGYKEDLESIGDFIRRYISKNSRWASPKFLCGESYGALRAAGLAGYLEERYGLYLNGIMLISGLIDFKTLSPSADNDLPYIIYLPAYTGAAHFHKKLPADLQSDLPAAVKQAEAFALGPYATALLAGNSLPADRQKEIAAQLARFTGLPADAILRSRLRISPGDFRQKLLEAENREIGRFDARSIATSAGPAADPSYSSVYGAFSTLLNSYLREELKFASDLPYEILTSDVQPWSYSGFNNRYVNNASDLAEALNNNPNLRIFVACGYHDLATPPLGLLNSIDHLPLDPDRLGNISHAYYMGGHMMYTNLDSLKQLSFDLSAFVTKP